VLHNWQVPRACRAQHIPPLPETSLSLDLQRQSDIHVMNLLYGTQMSDNNGTHQIAVFLVDNGKHGTISMLAHHQTNAT